MLLTLVLNEVHICLQWFDFSLLFKQMIYSAFDGGNYYVIPGSPAEAWEADTTMALNKDDIRLKMGLEANDFVIAVVGSQFLYRGLWLEHALVLQALLPVFAGFPFDNNSNSRLKIIVLSGDSTSNYSMAVEVRIRCMLYRTWFISPQNRNLVSIMSLFSSGHCC